jgi:succinyl-CoA synthetase beta subunit
MEILKTKEEYIAKRGDEKVTLTVFFKSGEIEILRTRVKQRSDIVQLAIKEVKKLTKQNHKCIAVHAEKKPNNIKKLIDWKLRDRYWHCPDCHLILAQKNRSEPGTKKYCSRCNEWYLVP